MSPITCLFAFCRRPAAKSACLNLKLLAAGLAFIAAAERQTNAADARSQWVYPGPDGRLVYQTTAAGDRIMDFSTAGYSGGGVALPDVPGKLTVKPSGGPDDTAAIQAAIDKVSARRLKHGFRGAVLLAPGTFTCSNTITLWADGVVLRGSGSGYGSRAPSTTIKMVGPRHCAINIGAQTTMADAYVPAGATSFTVANPAGFAVGDTISIGRPVAPAWIKLMGMDTMTRDRARQTWMVNGRRGFQERKLIARSGNKLTVDIPLADSYDAKYLETPGTTVTRVGTAHLTRVGVENLHIQCPPLEIVYLNAPYSAIHVGGDDCWVKDVYCEETMNSTVLTGDRITMERVAVTHTYPNLGGSKPADFSIEGSQILIDRCEVTGDNEYFVWTGTLAAGPNVVLNSTFRGRSSRIQPHERWATGLLVDNGTVPDGGIDFANRGIGGSGHGWTMGWGVAWNCVAKTYVIQNPPGAANWAIGCIGQREQTARYFDTAPILPEGIFDSPGTPVTPQSLYLAQLAERLGPKALQNIGYAGDTPDEFTNKSVATLPPWVDVDPEFGRDLAFHRPIDANSRGKTREFGGEKAVDGNDNTYWTVNDGVSPASLVVDLEGPLEINTVMLGEARDLSGRVQAYKVEGYADDKYTLLAQGTTIGERQVARFPKATFWKVRLTILKSDGYPAIRKIGLYLTDAPVPDQPAPTNAEPVAAPPEHP